MVESAASAAEPATGCISPAQKQSNSYSQGRLMQEYLQAFKENREPSLPTISDAISCPEKDSLGSNYEMS